MPADNEQRQEIRIPLPTHVWFNLLKSRDEYVRLPSPSANLLEIEPAPQEIEAKTDLEQYLYRLDAKLNYVIALLSDKIARKEYGHKGIVVDVSESGLRFMSPVVLPEESFVEIGVVLPNQPLRTMDFLGEVIWVDQNLPASGPPRILIGVKFIDILPGDQDIIVRYIFQKQREDIRRTREGV